MSTRKPWPHICEDCRTEFLSASNRAQRCPECRKRHIIEYNKARMQSPEVKAKNLESVKAYQARNREKISAQRKEYRRTHKAEIKAQEKAYYQEHAEDIRAKKREDSRRYYAEHKEELIKKNSLRQKAKRGDFGAKLELARITGKALFCERMRVTALSLPCGKREECWNGKPCPRTVELGLKPPKRRELFDFGSW